METIKKFLSMVIPGRKSSKPDKHWNLPPLSLLSSYPKFEVNNDYIKRCSKAIEEVLEGNNIPVKIVKIDQGPAFTRYTVKVPLESKLSEIIFLSNDLALATASYDGRVRIEILSEKEDLLALEVTNRNLEKVSLKRMIEQYDKSNLNYKLPVPLGVDVENKEQFADLVVLKNILMGGQTGSGKSVFVNSLINFLLLRFSPEDLKLLLVDMKRVEFYLFKGLPHLITDCLVDSGLTVKWLRNVLDEKMKSKNIKPYILVVIDTSSDIMLSDYRNDFINLINEILVYGPDLGIYLVMYDSRVGEEVFPTSFISGFNTIICGAVADKDASQLLINSNDGVNLLGRGDLLFLKKGQQHPLRLQVPWESEEENKKIIDFINSKN